MSCSGCQCSKEGADVVESKKPQFPAGCKSLLAKHLTEEIYQQLKDVKDEHGYTFQELINSGVVNHNSSVGVYAGSTDSYRAFAPLLDLIIEDYHGHKPADNTCPTGM